MIADLKMRPPLEESSSVEGQLFGSRPLDDSVVVDIEEPTTTIHNNGNVVIVEPPAEPIMITVVENGNAKCDGEFFFIYIQTNYHNQ